MTLRHALHAVRSDSSALGHDRKRQKQLIKAAKANKTLPVKGGALPVGGRYPLTCLGVTSEAFGDALGEYVRSNPDSSLKRMSRESGPTLLSPFIILLLHMLSSSVSCLERPFFRGVTFTETNIPQRIFTNVAAFETLANRYGLSSLNRCCFPHYR